MRFSSSILVDPSISFNSIIVARPNVSGRTSHSVHQHLLVHPEGFKKKMLPKFSTASDTNHQFITTALAPFLFSSIDLLSFIPSLL